MNVTVTLQFNHPAEAAEALAKLAGVISPIDLPTTGTMLVAAHSATDVRQNEAPVQAPQLDARAVFGGAAAAVVPPVAPVVPVPPVPTPPTAAAAPIVAPAATGSLELDSEGLPWDSRIHTEARSKNKDGTWRAKRGLNDEAKVKAIKAELLAAVAAGVGAPVPATAVVPTPPAGTPDPAPTVPVPPLPTTTAAATVVPAPPPTIAPSPAAAPAQQAAKAYHEVVMLVTPALSEGRITEAQVVATLSAFPGITGIPALATRPDLWTQAYYLLAATLGVA